MGFTANVVDGDIILAAWGNEIRDRTLQVFATPAERDQQWPATVAPIGAHCVTLDTGAWWRNVAQVWLPFSVVSTVTVSLAPASATTATTASTMTTWLTLPNVTVPAGATTATITTHVTNILRSDETAGCLYILDTVLSGGAYDAQGRGVIQFQVNSERQAVSYARDIATTPGVRSVLIGAARSSGTGQIQVSNISRISATVTFR